MIGSPDIVVEIFVSLTPFWLGSYLSHGAGFLVPMYLIRT